MFINLKMLKSRCLFFWKDGHRTIPKIRLIFLKPLNMGSISSRRHEMEIWWYGINIFQNLNWTLNVESMIINVRFFLILDFWTDKSLNMGSISWNLNTSWNILDDLGNLINLEKSLIVCPSSSYGTGFGISDPGV